MPAPNIAFFAILDFRSTSCALIRGVDTDTARQKTVKHTVAMLHELGVTPLCKGIETVGELQVRHALGVDLVQGYLIAGPTFEALAMPREAFLGRAARIINDFSSTHPTYSILDVPAWSQVTILTRRRLS